MESRHKDNKCIDSQTEELKHNMLATQLSHSEFLPMQYPTAKSIHTVLNYDKVLLLLLLLLPVQWPLFKDNLGKPVPER